MEKGNGPSELLDSTVSEKALVFLRPPLLLFVSLQNLIVGCVLNKHWPEYSGWAEKETLIHIKLFSSHQRGSNRKIRNDGKDD